MKRLFTVIACSAMIGIVARADSYIPEDINLDDGHEETISVGSGVTNVYTGRVFGPG